MFLHIGDDHSVPLSDIICILNCDAVDIYKNNEGNKSVVIVSDMKNNDAVYYSKISSSALYKRFNELYELI